MVKKDKRVRINKVMVGWSDGREVHLPPSVRRTVEGFGHRMAHYHRRVENGYEPQLPRAVRRGEARLNEEEADALWEQGRHIESLRLLMHAAGWVIEFDDDYEEWLDPLISPPNSPTVALFLHLATRCEELCRQEPRLLAFFEGSSVQADLQLIRRRYRPYGYDL